MQRVFVARSIQNIGKRTFASDAHAPPKKLHGTTGRYAGAVYTSASKVLILLLKISIIYNNPFNLMQLLSGWPP